MPQPENEPVQVSDSALFGEAASGASSTPDPEKGAGAAAERELSIQGPSFQGQVEGLPSHANEVILETDPERRIATLWLGSPSESMVLFNRQRLESLRRAIESLHKSPPVSVILTGPTPTMFAAGADIKMIEAISGRPEAYDLARLGQLIFDRFASLPSYKVAAISGPCLGGGFELALAADYRLITSDPKSVIGLPETKLGILPGWGGTQRLPRLVGVSKAIEYINTGREFRPQEAKECGLVDEVVTRNELGDAAIRVAETRPNARRELELAPLFSNKPPFIDQQGLAERALHREGISGIVVNALVGERIAALYASGAKRIVRKKTNGHYPAQEVVVDCVVEGLRRGISEGLKSEAEKLANLALNPVAQNLLRVFSLREEAKALGKAAQVKLREVHGAVFGAGVMGSAIASLLARRGCEVIVRDNSADALERGRVYAEGSIQRSRSLSQQEMEASIQRMHFEGADSQRFFRSNFVIEAIVERLEPKLSILSEIEEAVPPAAIIASNTSSLSITTLAGALKDPTRFAGMHFFNPVERMPLVEIIRGERTSDETVAQIAAVVTQLGKTPIVARDCPGFLVNRVLFPYLNEVSHLLRDGYAIEEIDSCAKQFGMPMGPVRLLDEIGLDVAFHAGNVIQDGYGERMWTPPLIERLIGEGRLGKKTESKGGFYTYQAEGTQTKEIPTAGVYDLLGLPADRLRERAYQIVLLQGKLERFPIMEKRLILPLLNEAVRALDEGVAGEDRVRAAGQIDLAMILGIGFAPYTGGPIRLCERMGAARLKAELDILFEIEREKGSGGHPERFIPCTGIVARANTGDSFYGSSPLRCQNF